MDGEGRVEEVVLDARSGLDLRGVFDRWPSRSERVAIIDAGRGSHLDLLDETTDDLIAATNKILSAVTHALTDGWTRDDVRPVFTWDGDARAVADSRPAPWHARIWSKIWCTADPELRTWTVSGQLSQDVDVLAQRPITAAPTRYSDVIYMTAPADQAEAMEEQIWNSGAPAPPPSPQGTGSTHSRCIWLAGPQVDPTLGYRLGDDPRLIRVDETSAWFFGDHVSPLPSDETRALQQATHLPRPASRWVVS